MDPTTSAIGAELIAAGTRSKSCQTTTCIGQNKERKDFELLRKIVWSDS